MKHAEKWKTWFSRLFWGCVAVFSIALLAFLALWFLSGLLVLGGLSLS